MASSPTLSPLVTGHLCLLAVFQELNLCPHASHRHSQGGSLAALTVSLSLSCLAAQLHFHARHHFSFWALLALQLPFWSLKKARWPSQFSSSKINTNITLFTMGTGHAWWGTSATVHLTRCERNGGVNSTQEICPSSAFCAEMTLVKCHDLDSSFSSLSFLHHLPTFSCTAYCFPLHHNPSSPFHFIWSLVHYSLLGPVS